MSENPTAALVPRNEDNEQLRLLAIFHYIIGGLTALFACLPLLYIVLGAFFIAAPGSFSESHGENQPPPAVFGWIFIVVGGFLFLLGQALAALIIFAGRSIDKRTHYTFSFIVSCVECIFMPVGTILGIFSIIVLSRDSVKAQFQKA